MENLFEISSELVCAWASAILIVWLSQSYGALILRGKRAAPPITSSFLILLIWLLLFLACLKADGSMFETLLPIFAGLISSFLAFSLAVSLRKTTVQSWTIYHTIGAIICAASFYVWYNLHSPLIGIAGALIADAVMAIPVAIKSYKDPEDIPVLPWVGFCIAGGLALFAIDTWLVTSWLPLVYLTASSAFILCIVMAGKFFRYRQ